MVRASLEELDIVTDSASDKLLCVNLRFIPRTYDVVLDGCQLIIVDYAVETGSRPVISDEFVQLSPYVITMNEFLDNRKIYHSVALFNI
jgi:hypothetical protein